jgi:formate transporter
LIRPVAPALLVRDFAAPEFWAAIGQTPDQYAVLTWSACAYANLLPVTIGNVIGGAGLVGGVNWFVYLRQRSTLR